MYIKHNSLGDDIPIVVVLKAMGLECDEEIVQLVGTEPEILDLFSGSLEEPYYLGIYSQDQVRSSFFKFVFLLGFDDVKTLTWEATLNTIIMKLLGS